MADASANFFLIFLIQAHDYTRGADLPDKTTHLTLHGVCEAVSQIDWKATLPNGMTPNRLFLFFARLVLTTAKEVSSLATLMIMAFWFSLLNVFPRP